MNAGSGAMYVPPSEAQTQQFYVLPDMAPEPPEPPINVLLADSKWMRRLRIFTYIMVCITCVAVLYSLFEVWVFINQFQTAVERISDSFTGNLFGDQPNV
jgi:hypothetical protein